WTKTGFILSDTDDTHTTEEYSRRNGEEGYTGKKISVSFQEERFLGLANREAPEATIRAIRKPEEENPLVIGERIFSHFIEDSDAKLGKIRESPPDLLVLEIEADGPIALANLSDMHIGNAGTDHRRMLEDARLIQKTPGMYAVFGGDGVDNFIKHQSAMVAKTSNPEEEYAALYWF